MDAATLVASGQRSSGRSADQARWVSGGARGEDVARRGGSCTRTSVRRGAARVGIGGAGVHADEAGVAVNPKARTETVLALTDETA